jgi:hypothetical protein
MAELTAARDTTQKSFEAVPMEYSFTIAANAQVFPGGMACLSGGYLVDAQGAPAGAQVVGVVVSSFIDQLNNLTGNAVGNSGLAGAFNVTVRQAVFDMASGTGSDLITTANLGQDCYAIDDETVGLTDGSVGAVGGATLRPYAGKIVGIDPVSGQVQVLVGFVTRGQSLFFQAVATAALSVGQIVAFDAGNPGNVVAATAGQIACGVVQNAPAIGGQALVCFSGPAVIDMAGTTTVGEQIESNAAGLGVVLAATTESGGALTGGNMVAIARTARTGAGLTNCLVLIGAMLAATPA